LYSLFLIVVVSLSLGRCFFFLNNRVVRSGFGFSLDSNSIFFYFFSFCSFYDRFFSLQKMFCFVLLFSLYDSMFLLLNYIFSSFLSNLFLLLSLYLLRYFSFLIKVRSFVVMSFVRNVVFLAIYFLFFLFL
jgi:hypothetical protein